MQFIFNRKKTTHLLNKTEKLSENISKFFKYVIARPDPFMF